MRPIVPIFVMLALPVPLLAGSARAQDRWQDPSQAPGAKPTLDASVTANGDTIDIEARWTSPPRPGVAVPSVSALVTFRRGSVAIAETKLQPAKTVGQGTFTWQIPSKELGNGEYAADVKLLSVVGLPLAVVTKSFTIKDDRLLRTTYHFEGNGLKIDVPRPTFDDAAGTVRGQGTVTLHERPLACDVVVTRTPASTERAGGLRRLTSVPEYAFDDAPLRLQSGPGCKGASWAISSSLSVADLSEFELSQPNAEWFGLKVKAGRAVLNVGSQKIEMDATGPFLVHVKASDGAVSVPYTDHKFAFRVAGRKVTAAAFVLDDRRLQVDSNDHAQPLYSVAFTRDDAGAFHLDRAGGKGASKAKLLDELRSAGFPK